MLSILSKDNTIYEKLQTMDDNCFFNAVVAHSVKETYSKLVEQCNKYNASTLGIYHMKLVIPRLLNKMVFENTGFDIESSYEAITIEDHLFPELAKHQLIEQMLEVDERGFTCYSNIAIAAMQRSGWYFDAEDIIIHSFIDKYSGSQRRMDCIRLHELAPEAYIKIKGFEYTHTEDKKEVYNLLKFSIDFAKSFGQLRSFLNTKKMPHMHLDLESSTTKYTKIEIDKNKDTHITLYFDSEQLAILEKKSYTIKKLNELDTFNIKGESYDLSLLGIKVLEMINIGNSAFTITGNRDYI